MHDDTRHFLANYPAHKIIPVAPSRATLRSLLAGAETSSAMQARSLQLSIRYRLYRLRYDGDAGMDDNGLRCNPSADGCFRIKTEYPQVRQLLIAANDTHSHDEDQFPAAFVLSDVQ